MAGYVRFTSFQAIVKAGLAALVVLAASSCCTQEFNSSTGIQLAFADTTIIEKITFVESGRTVVFNKPSAMVTLNPSGTTSTFLIYFNGTSGFVKLTYTNQFTDEKAGCNNALRQVYAITNTEHSFKEVEVKQEWQYIYNTMLITR